MVIQEEPINAYDKNMLGAASYIGIAKGKPFTPTQHQRQILEQVARDVQNYLIEISNGISWVPAEGQPGWTRFNLFPEDIKQGKRYIYENENGAIDYQRRAAITGYRDLNLQSKSQPQVLKLCVGGQQRVRAVGKTLPFIEQYYFILQFGSLSTQMHK